MIRIRLFIPLCICLLSVVNLALAQREMSQEQALVIAKAKLYAQFPDLNNPRVKILANSHSDKLMKLVFSNPFSLNGETYWNINTQFIWYGDPRIEYHLVGNIKGPQAATAPFDGTVETAIKAEVVKYLAYLANGATLNPNLRVAARPVKVFLFTFYTKDAADPIDNVFKPIGVDDGGETFHPNAFSSLVPKPW